MINELERMQGPATCFGDRYMEPVPSLFCTWQQPEPSSTFHGHLGAGTTSSLFAQTTLRQVEASEASGKQDRGLGTEASTTSTLLLYTLGMILKQHQRQKLSQR